MCSQADDPSMHDLADYWPPVAPDDRPETPRKHRHEWVRFARPISEIPGPAMFDGPDDSWVCSRCHAVRDAEKARRGKSSRRLGNDGERRSAKRYGWVRKGQYGGIDDLEGTLAIVQQKTSRRAPPLRWKSIFAALEGRAGGRIPLILLSYVRAGVDTEDFIVIRGSDWLALHGRDE